MSNQEVSFEDQKKIRQLRFSSGVAASTKEAQDMIKEQEQQIKKRHDRFNVLEIIEANPDAEQAKILARKQRFNLQVPNEEKEKIEKRRQRFNKQSAEELGITQAAVARYESGASCPSEEILLWYADRFKASLDFIFGRTYFKKGGILKEEFNILGLQNDGFLNYRDFIDLYQKIPRS